MKSHIKMAKTESIKKKRHNNITNTNNSNENTEKVKKKHIDGSSKERLKKTIIIASISVVGLIVFIAIFIIATKINFTLKDELEIQLMPLDLFIYNENKTVQNIDFKMENINAFFCKTKCTYEFNDISAGKTLDKGEMVLNSKSAVVKNYTIHIDDNGKGEKIYLFETECSNIKSGLCRTDEEKMLKTSIITVDYGLSPEEKDAIDYANTTLAKLKEDIKKADSVIKSNKVNMEKITSELNFRSSLMPKEVKEIISANDRLANEIKSVKSDVLSMESLWEKQDYISLKIKLKSYDYKKAEEYFSQAKGINASISYLKAEHDKIAEMAASVFGKNSAISEMFWFYTMLSAYEKSRKLVDITNSVNYIIERMEKLDFLSYKNITEGITLTYSSLEEIQRGYEKEKETEFVTAAYDIIKKQKNYEEIIAVSPDEIIENNTQDVENDSLNNTGSVDYNVNLGIDNNNQEKNSYTIISILNSYYGVSPISYNCEKIIGINRKIMEHNDNASEFRKENYPMFENDTVFEEITNSVLKNIEAKTENSLVLELKNISASNNSNSPIYNNTRALERYMILSKAMPNRTTKIKQIDFLNETYGNISIYEYKKMAQLSLLDDKKCNITVPIDIPQTKKPEIKTISGLVYYTIDSNYNTSIPEVFEKCCFMGKCENCCEENICKDDKSKYPVIFIHGHAFSKKTTPESSLNAFARIQKKLVSDGFINAGQIDTQNLANKMVFSEWTKANNPYSVRASYYYITYYNFGAYVVESKKNEGIENYAIRLKEIIDAVKIKTGKSKINIVAHSMGGLVARQYIALFGEESVNKLVMVGTPNKGVTGKVQTFCTVVGADRECEDLAEESVFLKRLNTEQNIPKKTEFYIIYGTGCDMEGTPGDGIVTSKSAILNYSNNYEIKGNCTELLKTDLHGNLLKPELYPEVYEKIIEIIKE